MTEQHPITPPRTVMTEQHPITPPPELVQQWVNAFAPKGMLTLATQAAQWGADQELEACMELLEKWGFNTTTTRLRAARRPSPKPPETIEVDGFAYRLVK
jgi:hypothetical protein